MKTFYVVATTRVEKHVAFLERFRKFTLPAGKNQLWLDFPNQDIKLFASQEEAVHYSLYLSAQRSWDPATKCHDNIASMYREWNGNFVTVRHEHLPVIYKVSVEDKLKLMDVQTESIPRVTSLNHPLSLHDGSQTTVNYVIHQHPEDLQIEFATVPFIGEQYYSQLADVQHQVTTSAQSVVRQVTAAGNQVAGYLGNVVSNLLWRQPARQLSEEPAHQVEQAKTLN